MSNITPGIFSSEWWISVVVVGITINLISGGVSRLSSKLTARISTSYAVRRDSMRREADRRHRLLVNSQVERGKLRAELTQRSLVGLENLLIAIFWMLLGLYFNQSESVALRIGGSVSWMLGCITWTIGLGVVAKTRFRMWDLNRAEREATAAEPDGSGSLD